MTAQQTDPTEFINGIHSALDAGLTQAMGEGDYALAARYATALENLEKWQSGGFQGPPPQELEKLSGISFDEVPLANRSTDPSVDESEYAHHPQESLAISESPGEYLATPSDRILFSEVSPFPSPDDEQLAQQFDKAKSALSSGLLNDAIAGFDVVKKRASNAQLRQVADRYLKLSRSRQQELLQQAIVEARETVRSRRSDFLRQREAWEGVLALDPGHAEAEDALEQLYIAEMQAHIQERLHALRKPLIAQGKRISDVEKARNEALSLLNSGELRDSELIAEAKDLYEKLDNLRDEMLRASEGGTSAERAAQYEQAMEVYRRALLAGYAEILDDATGQLIDPAEALRRVRYAYFQDLKRRVSQRYNDARESLAQGAPEAALHWLSEAIDLLSKVEERGDQQRSAVQALIDQATYQLDLKRKADKLILEAQRHENPLETRLCLMQAKQQYPAYPQIDQLIQNQDRLVLSKVISDITADIADAEGALALRKFSEARDSCNRALQRGLNLAIGNETLQAKRSEAEALLKEIGRAERSWQRLAERLERVDQALGKNNQRLAAALLGQFNDHEIRTPETSERIAKLILASERDQSAHVSLPVHAQFGDRRGIARSLYSLGLAYYAENKPDQALKALLTSQKHLAAIGLIQEAQMIGEARARIAYDYGKHYVEQGHWHQGLLLLEESLAILREGDDLSSRSDTILQIARTHHRIGNFEKACIYYRDALRLYEYSGNQQGVAACKTGLGQLMLQMGFLDDAINELAAADRLYRKQGDEQRINEIKDFVQMANQMKEKQPA